MINAIHALVFSRNSDTVRTFFRDVLECRSVDAGGGWLIFALPPAELGVHPTDGDPAHELYLMCDDIEATVAELTAKGVTFAGPVSDEGFGLVTRIKVTDEDEIALYQPKHPSPLTPSS